MPTRRATAAAAASGASSVVVVVVAGVVVVVDDAFWTRSHRRLAAPPDMPQQPPQLLPAARGTRRLGTTKPFPLQLQSLPPALRPLVRAYILGYASSVVPRLLTVILQHLSRARAKNENCLPAEKDERSFVDSVLHVLRIGLEPQRFPTFCAVLVGGATILQVRRPPPCLLAPLPSFRFIPFRRPFSPDLGAVEITRIRPRIRPPVLCGVESFLDVASRILLDAASRSNPDPPLSKLASAHATSPTHPPGARSCRLMYPRNP